MRGNASVVEINGKQYDVATGKPVNTLNAAPKTPPKTSVQARVMDGFTAPHPVRKVRSAKSLHTKTTKSKKLHPLVAKSAPKQDIQANPISKSSLQPKPARHFRAKVTPKSSNISKFAQPKRAEKAAEQAAPAQAVTAKRVLEDRSNNIVANNAQTVDQLSNQNWFEKLNSTKPKLMPTLAGVASVLVLAGYLTYVNLPNMALKLAANKAGFSASLPGYRPAGFSLDGPIAYGPGQIAINYASNSDQRGFVITQKQSNWDSQSLLDNYLIRENKRPVIFQEKGLTIYVYDGSNATWVDGGIWYTIEGDSLLSSEQILKIASSL